MNDQQHEERVAYLRGQAVALWPDDPWRPRADYRCLSAFWCGMAKGRMSPADWRNSFDRVLAIELGVEPDSEEKSK